MAVPIRTVLDLLLGKIHIDRLPFPVHGSDRVGRDQHILSHEPVPGLHHQVANGPMLVVEVELLGRSDLPVVGVDPVVLQMVCFFQHGEPRFDVYVFCPKGHWLVAFMRAEGHVHRASPGRGLRGRSPISHPAEGCGFSWDANPGAVKRALPGMQSGSNQTEDARLVRKRAGIVARDRRPTTRETPSEACALSLGMFMGWTPMLVISNRPKSLQPPDLCAHLLEPCPLAHVQQPCVSGGRTFFVPLVEFVAWLGWRR